MQARYRSKKSVLRAVFALLLALAVMFAGVLSGCAPISSGGNTANEFANTNGTDGRLRIIATSFAPYDFARQITGGLADVSILLPPGTESHSFEPTPQDIINIESSDIFIYVGGESDAWVDTVLAALDTSRITVITLIDCVEAKTEAIVEGMEEETGDADTAAAEAKQGAQGNTDAAEIDEHVWTSPQNAKLIVERIAAACERAEPAKAETYRHNTANYLIQLDTLNAQLKQLVAAAERKTLVFGDRFPFRYFTDAYGLDYFAAFPGCSDQTEASAATVAFLIDKVRAEQIPVVLKIELSRGTIAEAIAEATGAKVATLSSAHNVSRDEFTAGATYISVMQQNLVVLQDALN